MISGKKIQSTETYTNDTMLRSGFFSVKHARSRSRILDFFQDSRIRVKNFRLEVTQKLMWQFPIFQKFPDIRNLCGGQRKIKMWKN